MIAKRIASGKAPSANDAVPSNTPNAAPMGVISAIDCASKYGKPTELVLRLFDNVTKDINVNQYINYPVYFYYMK